MEAHAMAQPPFVFKRGPAQRSYFFTGFIVTLILSLLFSAVMSVFAAGTLTVQVYLDSNRNGTFDSGETGIGGILVSVYSAESVIVGLNTTDSSGQVVFPSLPDGNYRIEISNLGARVVSVPGSDNPGLLSFVTISGGAVTQRIGLRELDGGSVDTGAPAGTRSVSVRVWDDSDADGVQDAGEPSFSGLPVRLVDSLGNTVAGPVNTDALGRAIFNNAPTGAGYRVRILAADIPTGYILTQSFVNDGDPNPTIRDSNAVLVGGNVEATLPNTGRGVNIDSVDIGFTRGAVSGFIWRDNNRNGLWDSGEPRLNGVTVQIVSGSTVISTTTTRQRIGSTQPEDGGIFVFPSLPLTTTYQVVIPNSQFASGAPLFGAANSPNATGGDVGLPNGIPGTSDVTGPVLTVNATTNVYSNQRFGFYKGVVGDFVWLDDNSDSNQDSGEIGVNGVVVFVDADNDGIRDSGELFTVTINNPNNGQPGYYLFDDLPLGSSYRIALDPDNFKPGGALVGLGNSTGTAATNGNGDRYVYRDSTTLNASSPEDTGVDFGITRASIGNLVFEDANGNGVYDSGEPTISGVTVRAYRASNDTLLGTTTSGAGGIYTLPGLPAEEIYVTFDLSTAGAGYIGFVGSLRPTGTTVDPTEATYINYSDLTANVGGDVWRTDTFTPVLNTPNNGIDAGFYRPVRIVVRVFGETVNINNTREGSEPGISGVPVQVTGTESQTLTTNTAGEAIFNLRPGSYTVTVTTPSGYQPSPSNSGSLNFTNLPSQAVQNADFGYYRPGTISGIAFFDANGDSLANSGEPRLRSVTVELINSLNNVVDTKTTNTSGAYTFTGILPGNYTVRFTNPDTTNYEFITGGDSDVTTAGNVATSSTNTLTVPYDGSLTNIDAGFRGRTTVSGRIFEDNNADNLQDAGDADLSGATVTLTVTANLTNLVATYQATLSTPAPNYAFNNLPGGNSVTYTVNFAPPSTAYIASDANVGGNDTIDSDGPTVTITNPSAGGTIANIDQGYFRNVTITARVFREPSAGRNNQWDSGETGIVGVRVFLEQGGTPVLTSTTTTGGLVTFTARPGSYNLNVDESSTPLSGLLPSSGSTAAIPVVGSPLTSGSSSLTQTSPPGTTHVFGFYTFGTVSGRVFFDGKNAPADNSAGGEPGISGVTVRLLNTSDVEVGSATTDANGNFTITNIEGGSYWLEFVNPDATNFSFVAADTGDNNVARIVSNNGRTDLFTITDGQITSRSAALIGKSTVNGITFVDQAYDGQRTGDPVLANVTVNLTATVALPNLNTTITRATSSNSSGNYSFGGLPGGTGAVTFTLSFTPPAATPPYQVTQADVGDDATDSDGPAALTDQALGVGTTESRDQGYYQNVTVQARVFHETVTINNTFETGEAGLRAVTVNVSGPVSSSQATDLSGLVTFTGPPGVYTFTIPTNPTGYTRSPGNTGTAATALVLSGQTAPAVPFGYYQPAQISGQVFFDGANAPADNAASSEPGVGSVTVRLRDGNDAIITTTTTLPDGTFTISNVALGTYRLEFVNPDPANFSFVAADTADNRVASIVSDNGRTALFTVNASNQSIVRSAALIGKSTVNGITFVDQAYDGQRDTGDPALANVTVNLTATVALPNLNTTITRATSSNSSGNYSFGGLPGGTGAVTFTLSFTPPAATPPYQVTQADVGDDATDSDGPAALTDQPLGVGATASRDQGYYQNVTVQARVFHETVAINNTFETGEAGLRAVTVNVSGPASGSLTTDLFGLVTFSGPPGVYTFTVPTNPTGYTRSPGNTGTAATALVLSGQTAPAVPFGYYLPAQINGTVWFDTNSNGIFDSGEPGMENVSVRLVGNNSGAGTPVTTNSSGAFTITGIEPTGLTYSSYQLCFTAPTGFVFTSKGDTLTTDNNSDANPSGCTDSFTIASGANIGHIDAGLRGALSIGDLIWEDANGNGIQDSGEQALENVTITIQVQTNGGVINSSNPSFTFTTTSTGGSGLSPNYSIGNIPPDSTVTIQAVSRFGYLLTTANQGGNPETDSNAVGSSLTLTANDATIDFGLYRTTAIGNLVWYDVNGNGVRDTGEPGMPNLTIALRDAAGDTITSTQTLGDGSYAFSNLAPGSYSLRLTIPAGYTTTNNGIGSISIDDDNDFRTDGTTVNFVITSGQALGGVDAGLRGTGSVSGIAWFDTNENNVRDPGETDRVSGVRVTVNFTPTLLPALPQTIQVATDTNGAYNVTNLPPGEVTVTFTNLAGYLPAQPNVGGDDTIDSDGPVVSFTLGAGQNAVVDMGYYRRVLVYLPLTMVQVPPDLIVSIQATPANPNLNTPVTYQITVTNVGREPASNFWVDLYVNPRKPPEVNERWNDLSRQGLAWFFAGTLQPGESVTLNSRPRSSTNPYGYDPATSSPTWNGRLPPGRNTIYVYVDSWNRDESGNVRSPFGAVEEVNEANNRAEITIVVSE
jgi:hypothetical protein